MLKGTRELRCSHINVSDLVSLVDFHRRRFQLLELGELEVETLRLALTVVESDGDQCGRTSRVVLQGHGHVQVVDDVVAGPRIRLEGEFKCVNGAGVYHRLKLHVLVSQSGLSGQGVLEVAAFVVAVPVLG